MLAPRAESTETWLIYSDGNVLPDGQHIKVEGRFYYGYVQFPDGSKGTLDIQRRMDEIFNKIYFKHEEIDYGKPIITKKDDGHVVFFLPEASKMTLLCTKTEEKFVQSDAPVVASEKPSVVANFIDQTGKITETAKRAKAFPCDLETRDKGNTKITYTVENQLDEKNKTELLKATVRVHELYRFRITSGAVYSSLITKNRTYSTVTNAGGQQVISSSRANDSPANFPVFLKTYWSPDGRDLLVDLPWCSPERFNPIIGINLVNNPLENFYAGLSWEPVLGVDIVAGAHFAKITQIAGGFSDGQVVPAGTQLPITSKFLTGGFVGVTADVGVIGSWLGSQFIKTIKEGFR